LQTFCMFWYYLNNFFRVQHPYRQLTGFPVSIFNWIWSFNPFRLIWTFYNTICLWNCIYVCSILSSSSKILVDWLAPILIYVLGSNTNLNLKDVFFCHRINLLI
jgi:hypothetical protein